MKVAAERGENWRDVINDREKLMKLSKKAFISLMTLLSMVFVPVSVLYTVTIGTGTVTVLGVLGGIWLYYVVKSFEMLPTEKKKEIKESVDVCEKCMKRYYV